jgi:two-component system, chemotaxis family, CheB/CheR fusion protein
MVLFAHHDLLKDSPFSRLDLISCRNLLIYLNRNAQQRVFEIFHFGLVPHGRLFLGASESPEDAEGLFSVIDKKHRIFMQRPSSHAGLPLPTGLGTLAMWTEAQQHLTPGSLVAARTYQLATDRRDKPLEGLSTSWGELHFKLLEALAPPSILVDAEHDIVHLSPNAGRFLQYSGGEPSRNLLRAMHPSLRIELRAALYQAAQTKTTAEVLVAPVELGGESLAIAIRVSPVRNLGAELFLVTLSDRAAGEAAPPETAQPERIAPEPVTHHLERELERLKAHLRDTVEEYEAQTEELKAGNEELQAMNEELRSATEELETSREELQSINEELTTVNQELKTKVDELSHANSDIHNLMDATAIATVFLDRELRIARYTPSAVTLFNLISSDLGRPLADLATRLDYPQLGTDARTVLERLAPIEREVGLPDGKWFMSRLLPYRTMDDHIGGVVVSFIDITERKQAEEVRLWLSAVVASSTDAIISYSTDLTILSWNAGAQRIFGYSAGEAIGQPASILSPNHVHEQATLTKQLSQGGSVTNLETVGKRRDGTGIHLSLSISPIRDTHGDVIGGTAIARDITQQREAAEMLRVSQERLRMVVENATEYAIFSTDLERRITIWNSGAQRLLGYAEAEVLGQPADLIFTEEDRAAGAPEQEMKTALAEGRASDDRPHRRKDGTRFWASGSLMLMRDAQDKAVGFVKILRDQTAAREAQQTLERSQTDLLRALEENEAARRELQAADATKDGFLAVLSHELRNPLASIDSAAVLLLTQKLPTGDRESAAQVVKRQAGAMKALLDDLLDVSRLKLGRLELRKEHVVLSTVVQAALEATRPLLETGRQELKVDLPAQRVELNADPLRLGQVLSNLLTNAIKYTPAGGTIAVQARMQGDDQVVIAVADNGAGIEPAQIERMFDMYTQAHSAANQSHVGLGIGLALVKSIVELHGGWVRASSAGPGKGSEFTVGLPAARTTRTELPRAAKPAPAARTKRGLILIADDNVDAGWGIAKLLEIAGFATSLVEGGHEALRQAQLQQPDVGIIDIGMPDLNGYEVARQIRQAEWGKGMVLIAATGWGQKSDEHNALAAGFDAHMTKPVDLRKLSAIVEELLLQRQH